MIPEYDFNDLLLEDDSMDITIHADGLAEFCHEMFPAPVFERLLWPETGPECPGPSPDPEATAWHTAEKPIFHITVAGILLCAAGLLGLGWFLNSCF